MQKLSGDRNVGKAALLSKFGVTNKTRQQSIQSQFNDAQATMETMKELFEWASANQYDDKALDKLKSEWTTTVLKCAMPLYTNNTQQNIPQKHAGQVKKLIRAIEHFIEKTLPKQPNLQSQFNLMNQPLVMK